MASINKPDTLLKARDKFGGRVQDGAIGEHELRRRLNHVATAPAHPNHDRTNVDPADDPFANERQRIQHRINGNKRAGSSNTRRAVDEDRRGAPFAGRRCFANSFVLGCHYGMQESAMSRNM
jgi:hypothetical protein